MALNRWSRSTGERKPAELLKPVMDPAAWYPDEMAKSEAWIYRLSDAENDEIESAAARVAASGKDLIDVGREDFPLPRLESALGEVQQELMYGRGFAMLRGVRLDRMTRTQASIAFWGIGTYLGKAVAQNDKGHVLDHVKFQGGVRGKDRGYTTNVALGYHCDSCDILGLGVVNTGKSGGEHRIVSSVTLYNELLKTRPDLVKELGGKFHRQRSGDGYGTGSPWVIQRGFSFQDGYFTCRSAGGSILNAQKIPGVPPLTALQREALEVFKKMSDGLSIEIPFTRGDFFFVMNHTMMHSRTAYEDWPEPERKRHLMRLWISNGLRPLPPEIAETNYGPPLRADRVKAILEVA